MSLILDALRKADAERERGSVPSLHSHPVVPLSEETPAKPRSGTNWLWIAIGVSAGLLGAAAIWVMVGRDAPRASASQVAAAPAPSGPPAVAPAAPSPQAAPATAVSASSSPAPAATAAPEVAQPAPWSPPEERKSDERRSAPAEATKPAVPVLGNVPPADAPIYTRDQLPPNVRAELPQFSVGGSIYSPVPAARSLIVNGQLFREKDRLTQDLTLEEIKLKAAIFSFRGYRFEVPF